MFSKVFTGALSGIEPYLIEIEANVSSGLRQFNLIGLADTTIKEAKERVSWALKSSGYTAPFSQNKKVLINLAPADIKKEGSLYDLPIALAYLLSDKQIIFNPKETICFGELALNGEIKPIKGVFSFILLAQEKGFKQIVLPKENLVEARLALCLSQNKSLEIITVTNLKETVLLLTHPQAQNNTPPEQIINQPAKPLLTLGMIKGQKTAKMALEIAAAGGHNVIFEGPPGTGKTLLAKSIISILPELTEEELLETAKIYSSCGLLNASGIFNKQRPFRSPHHSSSEVSLLGGGNPPRPGEITLAHNGVLFLDEFPEFHRDVLQALRQPIEDAVICVQRAKYNLTLPANFTLLAAANPCPCGYFNDPIIPCKCARNQVSAYRRKLTGPLIDRFDIFSSVPAIKYQELITQENKEETHQAKERVLIARETQKQRFAGSGILTNSQMGLNEIKEYCQIDLASHQLLQSYLDTGKITARGCHRILKVSRTIADLKQNKNIGFNDVLEALNFRQKQNT